MTDKNLKKIGDEMVKVLKPVYEDLDEIKKTLGEHTDKLDALAGDVTELQKKADVANDRFVRLENRIGEHIEEGQKEHSRIKKFIGLSAS